MKEKKKFGFRKWEKDLNAKILGSFTSKYTEKFELIPTNIRKYIV